MRTAVIFHDLGKGHNEFQKILQGNKDNQWKKQRHELFSLPFVSALPLEKDEKILLERVVAGHHKTYADLLSKYISPNYPMDSTEFEDEFNLVDKEAVLEILEIFGGFDLKELKIQNPKKIISKYRGEQYLSLIHI